MVKNYSDGEMRRILQKDIEASSLTEQKIQEAYAIIRADAAGEKASRPDCGKVTSISPRTNVHPSGGNSFRKKQRWLLPAAAACILLVSTVTVAAALGGFFTKSVEQKEDVLTYKFEVDYDLTPYRMTVTPGYIPEGYTEVDSDGMKYTKDGSMQNGISLCVISADYLAVYGNLDVMDVKSVEETTINGMEASLITKNYDPERVTRTLDKQIFLFNSQEGYVGIVYGGNDLSMDELVKVAENLEFAKTDEKVDIDWKKIKEEEESQEAYDRKEEERLREKWAKGVPKEQIFEAGTPFIWGIDPEEKFELTMLEADIVDSISDLSMEDFFDTESIRNLTNEDGTFKPYERVTYQGYKQLIVQYGDEETEISRETAGQKLLKVKMQVKNPGEEVQELWAGAPEIQYLEAEKDGYYPYGDTYWEPLNGQEYGLAEREAACYFDASPYEPGVSHFFYRELQPGETITYTLGFIVDEDKTENLYLNFGGRMATSPEYEKDFEKFVRIR